jgi:DNA-binding protein
MGRPAARLVLLRAQEHGEVQLSALGIAVAPMVTVAEILKNRRLAVEKKITTSLESLSDNYRYCAAGVRMHGAQSLRTCAVL